MSGRVTLIHLRSVEAVLVARARRREGMALVVRVSSQPSIPHVFAGGAGALGDVSDSQVRTVSVSFDGDLGLGALVLGIQWHLSLIHI